MIPDDDESELRSLITKHGERAERDRDETTGDEFAARDAAHAGRCSVLVNEIHDSRYWFELAAKQFQLSTQRDPGSVESAQDLLSISSPMGAAVRMAVLSGNWELRIQTAETALAVDRSYPYTVEHTGENVTVEIDANRYHHLKTVAGIAASDDQTAQAHLHELNAILAGVETRDAQEQRFTAVARTVSGILDQDPSEIEQGLGDLLAYHQKHVLRGSSPETDDEAICDEATALLALARQRGLSVTITSAFIPEELIEQIT